MYYECSAGVYSTIMQWIFAAITLPKLAQRVLELVIHFVLSVLIPPFYYR